MKKSNTKAPRNHQGTRKSLKESFAVLGALVVIRSLDGDKPRSRRGDAARRFGLWAERLTLWLFWCRGWDLVAWREQVGRYELDLLLSRGPELRLLEVKARRPGTWVGADTALSPEQRLRLQRALRTWLDRVPWPGAITFQRASWAGWRHRLHEVERWEGAGVWGLESGGTDP